MEWIGIGIVLIIQIATVVVLVLLFKKKDQKHSDNELSLIQNQMQGMQESLQQRLFESQKVLKEVTQELTGVKETNKQVFGITEQLQNLEKVFKNQKQRGSIGEAGLELILNNILPPDAFELQYMFSNGEKVDAVIRAQEGIIPIDAKFSLDNYNRLINEDDDKRREAYEKEFVNDLKKRVDETAKYIRPEEKTLPFAFMFIPAEAIYYDLLVNEIGGVKSRNRSIIEYAYHEKQVIIVSPTTFAAYLQSILYGFKAFQIESSARDIIKRVGELSKHLSTYEEYMDKIGKQLETTLNTYAHATKEFQKIHKDVSRIEKIGDREED